MEIEMNVSDTRIDRVLDCTTPTPLVYSGRDSSAAVRYRHDQERIHLSPFLATATELPEGFERAGPRAYIRGNPAHLSAGIVSCGGLCPGLNDVIRGLVMSLTHHYGVNDIWGFRYGYAGLTPDGYDPIPLSTQQVETIHRDGGTMLGTSRGKQDIEVMVNTLIDMDIDMLFVIGGDGTQRGAEGLFHWLQDQDIPISIIGIPKTIDNDICWVDQSFGFDTAVEIAAKVINDAHVEAKSAERCIGLVKVMGRDSGFIAAHAALASLEANAVLIPEIPFAIEGDSGLLRFLEERIYQKDHAVLVVAEGAGQEHFDQQSNQVDASGNTLHQNIGSLLSDRIKAHFQQKNTPVNLKYFDPSYSVRSAPASGTDRIYCTRLAHAAVHAAMAGRTGMMVSRWLGHFVHVPLHMVTHERNRIDPSGSLWRTVLEATGQPCLRDDGA
jgi:6-phosphofructokinase 1